MDGSVVRGLVGGGEWRIPPTYHSTIHLSYFRRGRRGGHAGEVSNIAKKTRASEPLISMYYDSAKHEMFRTRSSGVGVGHGFKPRRLNYPHSGGSDSHVVIQQ